MSELIEDVTDTNFVDVVLGASQPVLEIGRASCRERV